MIRSHLLVVSSFEPTRELPTYSCSSQVGVHSSKRIEHFELRPTRALEKGLQDPQTVCLFEKHIQNFKDMLRGNQ